MAVTFVTRGGEKLSMLSVYGDDKIYQPNLGTRYNHGTMTDKFSSNGYFKLDLPDVGMNYCTADAFSINGSFDTKLDTDILLVNHDVPRIIFIYLYGYGYYEDGADPAYDQFDCFLNPIILSGTGSIKFDGLYKAVAAEKNWNFRRYESLTPFWIIIRTCPLTIPACWDTPNLGTSSNRPTILSGPGADGYVINDTDIANIPNQFQAFKTAQKIPMAPEHVALNTGRRLYSDRAISSTEYWKTPFISVGTEKLAHRYSGMVLFSSCCANEGGYYNQYYDFTHNSNVFPFTTYSKWFLPTFYKSFDEVAPSYLDVPWEKMYMQIRVFKHDTEPVAKASYITYNEDGTIYNEEMNIHSDDYPDSIIYIPLMPASRNANESIYWAYRVEHIYST